MSVQSIHVARRHLSDAKTIAGMEIHHNAASSAYLAAFHAAGAFVERRPGVTIRSHDDLYNAFDRAVRSEPRIDPNFVRFLADAYELKCVADYGLKPESVSAQQAKAAIATAERMIDSMATLLEARAA